MTLRLALRRLRARPASSSGVIALLAAGISVAATMFALSDPFLSRPLPYTAADRLVLIDIDARVFVGQAERSHPDYPQLSDWQARRELFDGLAGFRRREPLRVRLTDRAVALETVEVTPNFLEVLGIWALGAAGPAIPDKTVWLAAQTASGPLAGLRLDRASLALEPSGSLSVAGVLPASFLVPQSSSFLPVEAFLETSPGPIATVTGQTTNRLTLVARLHDGIDAAQAEAALNATARPRGFEVRVAALTPTMKGPLRPLAVGGFLAGVLVLIVSVTNTFGIALTRALDGTAQMATMEVLGASRARLTRLLLTEALVLGGASTVAGAVLLSVLLAAIVGSVPRNFVVLGEPSLSARVLFFTVVAGLVASAAWWTGGMVAWRRGTRSSLREATRSDNGLVRATRSILMIIQVAVTTVLLFLASLLTKSYLNLVDEDTGMSGAAMALSVSYEPDVVGPKLLETINQTLGELRRLPAVQAASAVVGEMADRSKISGVVVLGRPAPVELLWVSPEYFAATGMTLVEGRPLVETDGAAHGIVVNNAFAVRYLNGSNPIGRSVQIGSDPSVVVGVAKDSLRRSLDESPGPAVFRLIDQTVPALRVTYVTSGGNNGVGELEPLFHRISPGAVLMDGSTLRARLARTIQNRSFATLIVCLFAVATLAVTAAGISGVVGYIVTRRTREIGIRMAMGATRTQVTWLVVAESCRAVLLGGAVGLTAVAWLTDIVPSVLYGVSSGDSATIVVTLLILAGTTAAAVSIPARRASGLSPAVAVREE